PRYPWIVDLFGAETFIVPGRIYGGLAPGGPSMIPDECVIRIDTRPQPGISVDEVRGVIQSAVDRVQARDPDFQYTLELADLKNPHYIAPEAEVVQHLKLALEIVRDRPADYRAA